MRVVSRPSRLVLARRHRRDAIDAAPCDDAIDARVVSLDAIDAPRETRTAWLRTLSSCSSKKLPSASADAKVLAEKRFNAGGNFKGSNRLKCCVRAAIKCNWCVAASDARPSSRRTSDERGMAAARNEPIRVGGGPQRVHQS